MITRNGMVGLGLACVVLGAAVLASGPAPAAAGEKGLTVAPAIYRVSDDGAPGPTVQLVHRYYYGPGWGYYAYRPRYRPYVYAPPPVVTYPAYGYTYGYPAYGYGYPAYGYGYPGYGYAYPGYGYGYYGPRVSVGVGVW